MKRAAASAVVLCAFACASGARAEDGGSVAASRVAPPVLAVGFNPLALLMGRVGGDAIVFPSPSIGLIASLHHQSLGDSYAGLPSSPQSFPAFTMRDRGVGGEAGVRWYYDWRGGPREARGVFVGASFLFGKYAYVVGDASPTDYTEAGIAFDIGYTVALGEVFVVTIGAGVQFTGHTPDVRLNAYRPTDGIDALPNPTTQSIFYGDGPRPRLLLTIGFGR